MHVAGRQNGLHEELREATEFDEEIERNNYIDAVAGTIVSKW